MKYSYTKALRKLDDKEKERLKDIIEHEWIKSGKSQKKIVQNLRREHYLSENILVDLFQSILSHKWSTIDELHEHIYKFYRNFRMGGGSPDLSGIKRIGFTLTEYTLRQNIEKNYKDIFSRDPNEISAFIEDIKSGIIDPNIDMVIKGFDELLWLTFSEASNNPWDFIVLNDREEVYTTLALSHYYLDGPIILFIMELNDVAGGLCSRPTVFDAGEWEYFRPPKPAETKYGYTYPLNNGKLKKSKTSHVYIRRPEVVINSEKVKYKDIIESKGM